MKTKTCCFTGHRIILDNRAELNQKLKEAIITLVAKGVIYYGCGGAIGFDTLAALAVLELKKEYPNIRLIMVLPCRGQELKWSEADKRRYYDILKQADKVRYVSEHYYEGCMHKRNRHLVNGSDYCIAYLKRKSGGTWYTVHYARGKGVRVVLL